MKVEGVLKALSEFSIPYEIISPGDITGVSGISCNSKTIKEGELFVALKGTTNDGHKYIEEAIKGGAKGVVVEHLEFLPKLPKDILVILVPDTHKALSVITSAFYGFPTKKLHLIGITGTNGKTSTTILIESIEKEGGLKVGRLGTINYSWDGHSEPAPLTTPDPLLLQKIFHEMVSGGVTHVVMEVSSHALEQKRVFGCFYDVAVFTNLSHDHLDFHMNMENYFKAKSLLFLEHLNGVAVINVDDPYGNRLLNFLKSKNIEIISYGVENPSAKVKALSFECSSKGLKVSIETPAGVININSALLGKLNVYNILASVATAFSQGMDVQTIKRGIEKVQDIPGRMEKVAIDAPFEVIVDYAHTPDALEKTLSSIKGWLEGRLVVVFGCGGDRDKSKRPVMAETSARYADVIIITSDNPRTEDPEKIIEDILEGMPKSWKRVSNPEDLISSKRVFSVIVNRRSAIELALKIARPGDVVFLAGKGHENYQIIGHKKFFFDDRLVAKEVWTCLSMSGH